MIFIVLYVIVGVLMAMTVNRILEERNAVETNDLIIDIFINMFIILLWPMFVLLFIRSLTKYKENEK